jgi:tetratricopeptide (TPR) repeat protein
MMRIARIILGLWLLGQWLGWADPSPPKVALGHLGLASKAANETLADLITAQVSSDSRIALVERRSLELALRETELNLAGISRSSEVIRVGQLLPVDWFVLGSTTPIAGTNALLIRLVNAKTGVIQNVAVFKEMPQLELLGIAIAKYILATDWQAQTPPVRLAIGSILDVGINNRFQDFGLRLRAQLPLRLRGRVVFLERDAMSGLLNEIRLDAASLTQRNLASVPQYGALWMVDAVYQSYEVNGMEVELALRMEKINGGCAREILRGKPDDELFNQIGAAIQRAIANPDLQSATSVSANRQAEIISLLTRGRSLVRLGLTLNRHLGIYPDQIIIPNQSDPTRMEMSLAEARQAFEAVLILDPDNCDAKFYLAACLTAGKAIRNNRIGFEVATDSQMEKARSYYREVIGSGNTNWVELGRLSLARTYSQQKRRIEAFTLFVRCEQETTNRQIAEECRVQARDLAQFMREHEEEYPFAQSVLCLEHLYYQDMDAAHCGTVKTLSEILGPVHTLSLSPYVWFQASRDSTTRESHRDYLDKNIMPLVKQKYPTLWPYVTLGNLLDCSDPHDPAVGLMLEQLAICETNATAVRHPEVFFGRLIPSDAENVLLRKSNQISIYDWLFATSNDVAVIRFAQARQHAAGAGLAEPLTAAAKVTLAYAHMRLDEWSNALEVLNSITNQSIPLSSLAHQIDTQTGRSAGPGPWASTGSHFDAVLARNQCRRALGQSNLEPAVINPAEWLQMDCQEKVRLACARMNEQRWETALAILQSIQQRTVLTSGGGPWGDAYAPALPVLLIEECRRQLRQPATVDPVRFEFGKPLLESDGNVNMYVENGTAWVAQPQELIATRDFAKAAWKCALAPDSINTPITSICRNADTVWVATSGDGLFEFDLRANSYRQFRVKDGLLLDTICCLLPQGDTLWIGYGEAGKESAPGGLGKLDIPRHLFSALTPALLANQPVSDLGPLGKERISPEYLGRKSIFAMCPGSPGKLWLAGRYLLQYSITANDWACLPLENLSSLAFDATRERLVAGMIDPTFGSPGPGNGGLARVNQNSKNLEDCVRVDHDLPVLDVSALAAEGNIAWVGGNGYLAVVDMNSWKIIKVAYASFRYIHQIQLAGDFAWIRVGPAVQPVGNYGNHQSGAVHEGLYRFPRSLEKAAGQTSAPATAAAPKTEVPMTK